MQRTKTREHTASAAAERARIIEALIEVAAEHGYRATTVEMILDRAGLDHEAFERHFRGKYDCFLTAWDEINAETMEEIRSAYQSEVDWPDRLRAVAYATVRCLQRDPNRAAFGVEVLAAGDAARARRDMVLRVISSFIDNGRYETADPDSVPRVTAEALAGAAYGQFYGKIIEGKVDELQSLVPQLMAASVMPYLGVDAALEELSRGLEGPQGPHSTRYGRDMPSGDMPSETSDPPVEEYPPELARLPPGRHGLPREFIAKNQRERLIAGMAEAVAEHGFGHTTIAHITQAAGVSRRTFYEHFESKDDCFIAAYDTVMERLRERIAAGFEDGADWGHAIKSGIAAMLAFLAAEPAMARLCMVESVAAGPLVLERTDAALQSFIPYFRGGRDEAPASVEAGAALSPTTEEAVVGGMISLISRRVLAGEAERLEELLPDLVEFALTPYLGAAEAERIALG